MAGFGFGGGMADEQDAISNRRQDFISNMSQLIAQNPDLDVQGLMQLVNNAAGTDNTLRGAFTPQTLTPYVEGRNRAKRVQIYNTLQSWLKENPGASIADAQNAYYMFTGGNGGDPQMLNGFLEQARRRNQLVEEAEKERKITQMLQNRGAIEGAANDILMSTGDIEAAKTKFIQQFGTDSPYGISMDSLFTPQRMNDLATRKAIGILAEMDKLAGPDGDIRAYENIYASELTGATGEAYKRLVEQRSQQKVQGLNKSLGDVGAVTEAAKVSAIAGTDPKAAFEGYVYQQTGMSAKQAEEMGADVSALQRNFDDRYKYFKDEKAKLDEANRLQKVGELETLWNSAAKMSIAVDRIRSGKVAELETEILNDAMQRGVTNFTALDAKRIVQGIMASTEVATRNAFKEKEGAIAGDSLKFKEDLVKASKDAANNWWGKNSKGVADARGITDPTFAGLLESVAGEFDFSNANVAARADAVLSAWANGGSGDPLQLINELRAKLGELPNSSIEGQAKLRRDQMEIQSGRFGQTQPIGARDFVNAVTSDIQKYSAEIKGKIESARSKNLDDPAELEQAILMLQSANKGASGMPGYFSNQFAARQKNTDWLRAGEAVPTEMYDGLSRQAQEAFVPLQREAGMLLNAMMIRYRQNKEVSKAISTQTGGSKYDFSKLPGDIQSGYEPKRDLVPTGKSAFERGLLSVMQTLGNQYAEPEPAGLYEPFYKAGDARGYFMEQTPEELNMNRQIVALLNQREVRNYVNRNPAAQQLLKENPARFLEIFSNAIVTNAAPAGTTAQQQ